MNAFRFTVPYVPESGCANAAGLNKLVTVFRYTSFETVAEEGRFYPNGEGRSPANITREEFRPP